MGIGIDLKPIIEAVKQLAEALNRQAAAQEKANEIARETMQCTQR